MEKNKNFLFLTHLIPKEIEQSVRKKSRHNMQDAANALQWHIYEGLCANLSKAPDIVNIMPVGSFPQYYKDAFVKNQIFMQNEAALENAGFCNVKLLRKFLQPHSIYKALKKYYSIQKDTEKNLIVYTMDKCFLQAVSKIKKHFPDIKVCAVVADLPEMSSLSSKKSIFQKLFSRYFSLTTYNYIDCIDCFVLLTAQMADYINIKVPFCVMEGIATLSEHKTDIKKDDIKRILYTGTLHRRFGVLNLVEAFEKTNNEDFRLILCGVGDSEQEIKDAASRDSRIIFMGQVPREEALALQAQATVLINPRPNTEEFTKYSFPSKNLEYLSSGKPLIAYKLDGIPDEYDDYIYYINGNSIEELSKQITEICEKPEEELELFGEKARIFVTTKKNSKVQVQKILELISNLSDI